MRQAGEDRAKEKPTADGGRRKREEGEREDRRLAGLWEGAETRRSKNTADRRRREKGSLIAPLAGKKGKKTGSPLNLTAFPRSAVTASQRGGGEKARGERPSSSSTSGGERGRKDSTASASPTMKWTGPSPHEGEGREKMGEEQANIPVFIW